MFEDKKIKKDDPFFPSLLNFAAARWHSRCCLIEAIIMISYTQGIITMLSPANSALHLLITHETH